MSTSTSPAPVGPRAMAEQDILKIIWPPDGRVPWEDRRKVPEIERTIGHLLDVIEADGNSMIEPPMSPEASYRVTQKIIDLKASGYTEVQIAEMTGLTKDAVHNRLCRYRQKQQTAKAQGVPTQDQSVEVNKMIADMDSADHIVEANDMVAQAQPKVEQVPGQAALQEAKPEQNEKPQGMEQKQPPKSEKVPLTDEQKAKILELHAKGVNNHDIAAQLGIKDSRQVQGTIIARRKTAENVPAVQSSDTPPQPAKDVMLLQQPANVADTSAAPKPADEKPTPEAISRAELDTMIWELHKAGKTPEQISDALYAEGLYYSEKSVIIRLRSQGADI